MITVNDCKVRYWIGSTDIMNNKYATDPLPIDPDCGCPACRNFSRGYIRHLLKAGEMLGMRLCVLHNLYYYNHLMEEIRAAIREHRYSELKKQKLEEMSEKSTWIKQLIEQNA